MGHRFVTGGPPDQVFLLPPDAREWLPPGHLAWAVLEQAGRVDLAAFEAGYRADGRGRPAYHPAAMVALVMYCYCKGIRSSRAIEMATFDDVGARVIMGGLHPDHATVARFVTRHEEAVKGLLVASLAACAREGLVSVDVVAGDGTKVKANASMAANATAAQLDAQIAELEQLIAAEVGRWLEQARAEDAAEDALLGHDDGPGQGGGPGTLARTADKIVRRQQARARLAAREAARQQDADAAREDKAARLEARAARHRARAAALAAQADARLAGYQARAAAKAAAGSGKRPDGRAPAAAADSAAVRQARQAAERAERDLAAALAGPAPAPGPPLKANTTDPASRVMPGKHGGFAQAYNPQVIAVRRQVITSIGAHDSPADMAALHPALAATRANLDAAGITGPIRKALFDTGYASEDNFTAPCEAELYVAVTREARQTGRQPGGRAPASSLPGWQAMTARLDTPEGKALYRQRAGIIEPVFAQLFARLGRHLNYRGARVDLELHLWAASHNFLKAIRERARTSPARQPALA
jgi:transposase